MRVLRDAPDGPRAEPAPGEIVGQVRAGSAVAAPRAITNVVLMGMGEPLANYDAVRTALEILTAEWGTAISPATHHRLDRRARAGDPALIAETRVNLAVSLTATTDAQRARLMPVNRRYPLAELLRACRELPLPRRKRITFEYVMLAGENDADVDARRLVSLLHGLRAKINLIPFNPFPGAGFAPSPRGADRPLPGDPARARHQRDHSQRAAGGTSGGLRAAGRRARGGLTCPGSASSSTRTRVRTETAAPERVRRLSELLGKDGTVRVTESLPAIEDVAREFRDRGTEILAICGGDGSYHCTLTGFPRRLRRRAAPAPPAPPRRHHQLRREGHRRAGAGVPRASSRASSANTARAGCTRRRSATCCA
jgi:hypothetical protein